MSRTPVPTTRELWTRYSRGGGDLTQIFNQRVGAFFAVTAVRMGLSANTVSVLSACVGVTTSTLFVIALPAALPAALIGVIGWQLAYSLDCADGQVARLSGKSSPRGAVLDLLIDFLVHTSVAIAMLNAVSTEIEGPWREELSGFFTAAWLMGPYFEALYGQLPKSEGTPEVSPVRRMIRLVRDYSLHVTVLPLLLLVSPEALLIGLVAVCLPHAIALFVRIGSFARS